MAGSGDGPAEMVGRREGVGYGDEFGLIIRGRVRVLAGRGML